MADSDNLSAAELRVRLKQTLESLGAAGVEWLPDGAPVAGKQLGVQAAARPEGPAPASPFRPPAATANPQAAVPSLFDPATASPPVAPPDERRRELVLLTERVASCTRCPHLAAQRTQTVFGVGPVDAELCFVGEAPGSNEDQQGEPFVGEAGQLLNRIIAACGMKRDDVYICNIIKCRPPGNRPPTPDEAAHCRDYLLRQLELVRPKFICCLGACAAQNLLQTTLSIGRLRGRFHDYRGTPVICTYHPAYLLRTPDKRKDVWEDMKQLLAKMGRPIPQR